MLLRWFSFTNSKTARNIQNSTLIIIRKIMCSNHQQNFDEKDNCKSSSQCVVAVCQFTATNNKDSNLETVQRLVENAASKNAQMIFLPEACDFIAVTDLEALKLAEPLDGPLMTAYKTLAKRFKVWLSIGGFHETIITSDNNDSASPSITNKYHNSHVVISGEGELQAIYRKLHLFDVKAPEKDLCLTESNTTVAGSGVPRPVQTPCGAMALAICYDVRFPELAILARKFGAQILTYPSAFSAITGRHHWATLLRSRAIESQCYVVAAAQFGRHNSKRSSYGQSLIVNPWGEIIAELPIFNENTDNATNSNNNNHEVIALTDIDLNLVHRIRLEMPIFQHRRHDCYQLTAMTSSSDDDNKCSAGRSYTIDDREMYSFDQKSIPASTVFYRSATSFAFTNIRCVVPGHVLVSTLRHAKRLEDLHSTEISDLFQTVVIVQKAIEKHFDSISSTICVQDGKYAGQTVPHVHVHIMPRKLCDFAQNDDIYGKLAEHDRNDNPEPFRSIDEMTNEAQELRRYFL